MCLIKWIKLTQGSFLLNTDDSSKGNLGQSGGGGILHSTHENMILAYLYYFGSLTGMQAEVKALIFGTCLCRQHGYFNIQV